MPHCERDAIIITTEHLLVIESEAQEAMRDMAKETERLAASINENLEKRVSAMQTEGAEKIKQLAQETENEIAKRTEQIQNEYRIRAENFENEFKKIQKKLRGKIFHDILHGEI